MTTVLGALFNHSPGINNNTNSTPLFPTLLTNEHF